MRLVSGVALWTLCGAAGLWAQQVPQMRVDVRLVNVGVLLAGQLVDKVGVQAVLTEPVATPYLVQRVGEEHERDEDRQRRAQVEVERHRYEPERRQHQQGRNRSADHRPDGRTLACEILANPVAHGIG